MEVMTNGHLEVTPLASEPWLPSANGESLPDPRVLLLSARQWETLELAAEGLPNAQIARRLFITESTVKQHLGIRNRREAAGLFGRDDQAGRRSAAEEVRS
jgi:DNA-binding NarL/FixJ family response regulator